MDNTSARLELVARDLKLTETPTITDTEDSKPYNLHANQSGIHLYLCRDGAQFEAHHNYKIHLKFKGRMHADSYEGRGE